MDAVHRILDKDVVLTSYTSRVIGMINYRIKDRMSENRQGETCLCFTFQQPETKAEFA